jgi:glycerol 3-phosphatase-2
MTDDAIGSSAVLSGSGKRLTLEYDVALLDLDGVVYVGPDAVPGAPHALEVARADGMRLTFVTNNAARTPQAVALHLTELGIAADPAEVVTSAQVAAHYLADRLPAGSPVLVVGTEGLIVALRERGLTPVHSASDSPVAVVQGYSPNVDWAMLAEGAVAIRAGALWVATNLDATVPSPRGPLPGNGSMVAALIHATDRQPISTGKPDPTMHQETVERSHARRPLVVGDRLDTDIEGAHAVGCDSILVLSGVTVAKDLIQAPSHHRATYLGRDLGGLLYSHPVVASVDDGATCGRWVARRRGGEIVLSGGEADAPSTEDGLDALRALCGAAWGGDIPSEPWTVESGDDEAKAELLELGL